MPWSKERRAAHMRAKRAKDKSEVNLHDACDRRIAELEAIIAAKNEEIARLKVGVIVEGGYPEDPAYAEILKAEKGDTLDDVL